MTDAELSRANDLKKRIDQIESFLQTAERLWEGRLVTETSRTFLKSVSYGAIHGEELLLDNPLKNKMLDVLRLELNDLRQELNSL